MRNSHCLPTFANFQWRSTLFRGGFSLGLWPAGVSRSASAWSWHTPVPTHLPDNANPSRRPSSHPLSQPQPGRRQSLRVRWCCRHAALATNGLLERAHEHRWPSEAASASASLCAHPPQPQRPSPPSLAPSASMQTTTPMATTPLARRSSTSTACASSPASALASRVSSSSTRLVAILSLASALSHRTAGVPAAHVRCPQSLLFAIEKWHCFSKRGRYMGLWKEDSCKTVAIMQCECDNECELQY